MLQTALALEPIISTTATIICADNRDFLPSLADQSMNLIVTSPPYNIGKSYEQRTSLDLYLEQQQQIISECVRLLHPQG